MKITSTWYRGKSITGLGNKSNERKLTESQKQFQKLKEQIEKEKDSDIKAELKKGNIVTIVGSQNE
jgi:hypothetical protein